MNKQQQQQKNPKHKDPKVAAATTTKAVRHDGNVGHEFLPWIPCNHISPVCWLLASPLFLESLPSAGTCQAQARSWRCGPWWGPHRHHHREHLGQSFAASTEPESLQSQRNGPAAGPVPAHRHPKSSCFFSVFQRSGPSLFHTVFTTLGKPLLHQSYRRGNRGPACQWDFWESTRNCQPNEWDSESFFSTASPLFCCTKRDQSWKKVIALSKQQCHLLQQATSPPKSCYIYASGCVHNMCVTCLGIIHMCIICMFLHDLCLLVS